jgi:predicted transcriptional regulator
MQSWTLGSESDMTRQSPLHLSRRERQIMDVIYRLGEASALEVRREMPDAPSYSSVRTMLGILEQKGHLVHRKDGLRYVYAPTRPREAAARTALRGVLRTFFGSSTEKAVAALLDLSGSRLSQEELDRLGRLVDEARKKGD